MLRETCRVVIPIKLEFSESVGFIHKEFVTLHGHTILNGLYSFMRLCVSLDLNIVLSYSFELFVLTEYKEN
jgi:hypothetical protein